MQLNNDTKHVIKLMIEIEFLNSIVFFQFSNHSIHLEQEIVHSVIKFIRSLPSFKAPYTSGGYMSKRCDGVIVISPLNVWYVFQTHARFEFITAMAWENNNSQFVTLVPCLIYIWLEFRFKHTSWLYLRVINTYMLSTDYSYKKCQCIS